MRGNPTLYDLCDPVLRGRQAPFEQGRNLLVLYRKALGHPLLKAVVLGGCRHPAISAGRAAAIQDVLRAALEADPVCWRDPDWVARTMAPLAELLDAVQNPRWQLREPVPVQPGLPARGDLDRLVAACLTHVRRVWKRHADPYFPVAAQVLLSGDDQMTGPNLIDVLTGLGSFEYQNVTLLFGLARAFLLADPRKLGLVRKPYPGLAEPLRQPLAWIRHRTAFYDAIFFEQLFGRLTKNRISGEERQTLVPMLESLVRYLVVASREWLVSPRRGLRYPAITCLPKDEAGRPLCRLSAGNWRRKQELGFGDYVPDVDTTFFTLSMARRWLDLARGESLPADPALLAECEAVLDHPWPSIIGEYQIGGQGPAAPLIRMGNPLDPAGAVQIWFDKPFAKPDGLVVREVLGNEICPGHNLDILESLLRNRRQWRSLEGASLAITRGFLDFLHAAFASGLVWQERSVVFYLPEVCAQYAGRVYDAFLELDPDERRLLDPAGKMEAIRASAIAYCCSGILGQIGRAHV